MPRIREPCLTAGLFAYPGVNVDCPEGHITGTQAALRFRFSRSWCNTARLRGKLTRQPCGHYLYEDVKQLERQARETGLVRRGARAAFRTREHRQVATA